MITGHEIRVGYTNEDDGIWLDCTCGWGDRVGEFSDWRSYHPTLGAVLAVATAHWDGVVQ